MRRGLLVLAIVVAVVPITALAQGTITGTVTDDTGTSLPGANVAVIETQLGAATTPDGRYTIENVPAGTHIVAASFVGYTTHQEEVTIQDGQTLTVDFRLTLGVQLDGVTVDALGFAQNPDQLGTAQSTVGGDALVRSGETNILRGLAAKSPGLNITASGGDPGSSTRILIRGQTTITGNNQPLIVIDGVPVSNATFGSSVEGVQQASRLNDINPDDIESVEVLRSASAAALWGSRAQSGVLVITTKSGRGRVRPNVSFRSTVSFDEVNKTASLQNAYSGGINGFFQLIPSGGLTWGDRIGDRSGGPDNINDAENAPVAVGQQTGTHYYTMQNGNLANPHGGKNSQEVFDHNAMLFGTGTFLDQTLSVSAGDANTRYYLSVGHLNQDGVVRSNSNLERTSIRVSAERSLSRFVTVDGSANYIRSASDRIQQGSNLSGLLLGGWRQRPDFDPTDYTVDFYPQGLSSVPMADRHRSYRNPIGSGSPIYDNPFFTIERNLNTSLVNRLQGRVGVSVDPMPWLNLSASTGADFYSDRRYVLFPAGNATEPDGYSSEQNISEFQLGGNLIARATHALTDDIDGSFLLGMNLSHREFDNLEGWHRNFINPLDYRTLSNAELINIQAWTSQSVQRTIGTFAEADFGLYNQVFFKLTGRIDNASTFGPEASRTFFYPSASIAWQFSEMLPALGPLSFGKLRAGYGIVGREPAPYSSSTPFGSVAVGDGYTGFSTLLAAAYGGGFRQSSQLGNVLITPERKREAEIGLDLRFLADQYSLSATYYDNRTEDVIFGVDVAPSTGFTSRQANAAVIDNTGIELSVEAQWPRVGDFSWNTYASWWTNRNMVVDLAGVEEYSLAGFIGGTSSLVQGEPFGVFYGTRWRRAHEGCTVDTAQVNCQPLSSDEIADGFSIASDGRVLDSNGFPVEAASPGVLGDTNPDWRAAIGNTFGYRGLTLNMLFDFKIGGIVWNGTKGALWYFGVEGEQDWATTVSAQEAGSLTNWLGCTLVQMAEGTCSGIPGSGTVRVNDDGTYTFRGYIDNFGAGDVIVDEYFIRSGPLSGFTGPTEAWMEDGSFVRLRELTLGYTWRDSIVRRIGLNSIDFSLTGRNLWTATDYTGIDPETNLTGPSNGQGLDYFNNPFTRSYQFSVRLNY